MGEDVNSCALCLELFLDPKAVIQCTKCDKYFHPKCENVELRGFHMKKSWKCSKCLISLLSSPSDGNSARKRFRSESSGSIEVSEIVLKIVVQMLERTEHNTNEIKKEMKLLRAENAKLREDIAQLKDEKMETTMPTDKQPTYASIMKNNEILIVNPVIDSNTTSENEDPATLSNKVKEELRTKVSPSKMGMGISMRKTTKKGGVILQCSDNSKVDDVQVNIQQSLGSKFTVTKKALFKNRFKITGINEREHSKSNEDIINKIINQNELDVHQSEIEILFKSRISDHRFHMITTVNDVYQHLIIKEKVNLGWSQCRIIEDFGVIRCFKCSQYGHVMDKCDKKFSCPICAGEHEKMNCPRSSD